LKSKLKKYICGMILIIILNMATQVFATERLVDIPVPPNSTGYADFTEEEAEERAKKYEESKNNSVTSEHYVGKSSDYYLKSLNVEGYELSPKFNKQNDTYIIYTKDRNSTISLNIMAELDNVNAKIEGAGVVELTPDMDTVNINVIAENGNLKVYTIKVEDEENKPKDENVKVYLIITTVVILFIIGSLIFIIKKKRKLNKKVE